VGELGSKGFQTQVQTGARFEILQEEGNEKAEEDPNKQTKDKLNMSQTDEAQSIHTPLDVRENADRLSSWSAARRTFW
jgi:hypothetical protein